MENKNLITEIERIKNMMMFLSETESMTEARTPAQKLAALLNMLKTIDLEDDIVALLEQRIIARGDNAIELTGKKLTSLKPSMLSVDDIALLFKSKAFKRNFESWAQSNSVNLTSPSLAGDIGALANGYKNIPPPKPAGSSGSRVATQLLNPQKSFFDSLEGELKVAAQKDPELKTFYTKVFENSSDEVKAAMRKGVNSVKSQVDNMTDSEVWEKLVTTILPDLKAIALKPEFKERALAWFERNLPIKKNLKRGLMILIAWEVLGNMFGSDLTVSQALKALKDRTGFFDPTTGKPTDEELFKKRMKEIMDSIKNNRPIPTPPRSSDSTQWWN